MGLVLIKARLRVVEYCVGVVRTGRNKSKDVSVLGGCTVLKELYLCSTNNVLRTWHACFRHQIFDILISCHVLLCIFVWNSP